MILAIDLILTHGGGQQVLLDFIGVARSAGREVTALVGAGGWIQGRLGGGATAVVARAPSRHRSSLPWRAWRLARFCAILLRHRRLFGRAEQIVVNDPEVFLPATVLARMYGKSVSLYLHMAYTGLAARLIGLAGASFAVTRLICVSSFVRQHLEQILPQAARHKLVVIENAVPRSTLTVADRAPAGDVSRVAIVGRLVPDKGQDVVCGLAPALPRSRFYLVGPFDNADAAFVDRLRNCAGENVMLVGYKHPVADYLLEERIGIVLAPARVPEALGLTPIEATLAGCAVIVRNIGGLAEVASSIGLRAVENDDQFGEAIRHLQALTSDELGAQLQAARQRALARYHPDRFERDVRLAFDWR